MQGSSTSGHAAELGLSTSGLAAVQHWVGTSTLSAEPVYRLEVRVAADPIHFQHYPPVLHRNAVHGSHDQEEKRLARLQTTTRPITPSSGTTVLASKSGKAALAK